MTAASAPGKVILFGEHAVVSGAVALGGAIDLRARVRMEDMPGRTQIDACNLMLRGFSYDLVSGQVNSTEAANATRYISAVLKEFQARDLRVSVESGIPVASGLGSSAAIVVATIAALNCHMDLGLSRKEIASKAHEIEKAVQHGLGSLTDTTLATYGGHCLVSSEIQLIDLPGLDLVVGCTRRPHDTMAEVERVQSLHRRQPEIVGPVFQAIGAISSRAESLMREQRQGELGELMNINHGLLEALGVGTRELCELIYAARGAGRALGAKITGAGGGGCMIALPRPNGAAALTVALEQARGTAFMVRTGCDGVRVEG
ncbi:MAG TPA: mevalonate kinase [Methanothrix sp.]|nr:mevalonate kinase [Methanothrix sp.]